MLTDAACPPNGQTPKPGPEPGLIVQCPLATKDRQEVVPEKPPESSHSSSAVSSIRYACLLVPIIVVPIL